jgi:hypothetical protein
MDMNSSDSKSVRIGRVLTWLIFLVGVPLFLYVQHWANVRGIPAIGTKIGGQLRNLTLQSPSLTNLVIEKMGQSRIIGGAPPFRGEIQYQGQRNGRPVDLLVYWAGDSTNCQIMKIELVSNNSEPQILWTNSHN